MEGSIVRNKKGMVVGAIQDRTFYKEAYGSKHRLRNPAAWSIDKDIFDRVIVPNCLSIRIMDMETKNQVITGVDTFRENMKEIDRGFGHQYILELIHWRPY